jgi:urease accessory protein
MNPDPSAFIHLLQFADGLFPAGGYAHSFGLETLVQSGRVQTADDVASFLRVYLENSAAPTDAVIVLAARKAALDTICQPASASIECSKP